MNTIRNWSNRRGWTPEEDAILHVHYGKAPISQFAYLLPGRTEDAIQLHATRYLGLNADQPAMSRMVNRKRYDRDEFFFSKIHPLASYWAGFIAADGCIGSPRDGISIKQSAKDGEHLQQLNIAMGFTRPLSYVVPKSRGGPLFNFTVCSAQNLIADLWKNYNIGPRKSLSLTPPRHLDRENTLAFIIGYIDGDGCIRVKSDRTCTNDFLALKILGSPDFLSWITDVFRDMSPPGWREAVPNPTQYHIWAYELAGRRAADILNQLLAVDVPSLARKWDIVRHFPSLTVQNTVHKTECSQ
jgi:hypothetical protein